MEKEIMKSRLTELLKKIPRKEHIVNGMHVGFKLHTAESVAEYLIEQGVILPMPNDNQKSTRSK